MTSENILMKKFDIFTDNKYDIHIKWITKKVKQLLILKSKNLRTSKSCEK